MATTVRYQVISAVARCVAVRDTSRATGRGGDDDRSGRRRRPGPANGSRGRVKSVFAARARRHRAPQSHRLVRACGPSVTSRQETSTGHLLLTRRDAFGRAEYVLSVDVQYSKGKVGKHVAATEAKASRGMYTSQ
ncbi:hypothetical protein PVAP13_5KG143007 [Panicum virgatum]|uniref:Uncharacterized protein n=1 Tax=Panicum virgatum TaxID=38727 RepID=A0A8T0SFI4_PANVG|nr:hypothetical protein PVAP13_5KG143007 [Panicum virgatum]